MGAGSLSEVVNRLGSCFRQAASYSIRSKQRARVRPNFLFSYSVCPRCGCDEDSRKGVIRFRLTETFQLNRLWVWEMGIDFEHSMRGLQGCGNGNISTVSSGCGDKQQPQCHKDGLTARENTSVMDTDITLGAVCLDDN